MRVALHVDGRTLRGNEQQLLLLTRGLRARGHDVAVSAVAGSETFRAFADTGAVVTGIRPRGDADVLNALRFTAWLRSVRPDALLATSWKRATTVLLSGVLAGVPRRVFRLGYPHSHKGGVTDRLRVHALTHWADACYVNSAELRTHLLAYAPQLTAAQVPVVLNAFEVPQITPAPLREELGLHPGEQLIVSTGGLEPRKGFDVLLRAFAALDAASSHLAIAGSGPQQPALVALAETLGVAHRVHFLGQRADVAALLRAADAFALASRSEGSPNSVLEAMAAGLPVVSTAVFGVAGLLEARADQPAAGWIVAIDDVGALAAALHEALGPDGPKRGAEALRRVRAEHAPAQTVAAVEALLQPV